MILIENGKVVDPITGTEEIQDILIRDNRVETVGRHLHEAALTPICESGISDPLQIINADGFTVMPGFIDVHSHFRDPGFTYKEDIESGARAASHGGYTTVVLMANTKPPVDQVDTLNYVLDKGRNTEIRVETCAAVSVGLRGEQLTELEKLHAAGACGFTDDGIPLMNAELLGQALNRTAKLGVPLSLHEEDPALITNNGVNRGAASEHYHIGGSPREAEITLVKRDLALAYNTGAILNLQHISTAESVEAIREAKKNNPNLHAEACPHHFTLTEEAVIQYGTLAKMNPPLRTKRDRESIIEGIMDNTLDLIATDHAPHSIEEKNRPLTEAPSGIIGLETALSLSITELVKKHGMSMPELARRLSYTPSRMYGFKNRGYIAEGALADIVIVDTEAEWTPLHYESKSINSPFTGKTLQGVIKYTICDGRIVYKNED